MEKQNRRRVGFFDGFSGQMERLRRKRRKAHDRERQVLEEDREGTDAMGQESMLAAPTQKEDQVAVAPKETVDKATEKRAEARLEEQQGIWEECQCSRRSRTEGLGRPAISEETGKSGRKVLEPRVRCPEERSKAKEVEHYLFTFMLMGVRLKLFFAQSFSVNQLSIYGAVPDLCEEYSCGQTRTGRLVLAEQSDPLFAPEEY